MTQTDFFDPTTAEDTNGPQGNDNQPQEETRPTREKGLWNGSYKPIVIPDAPAGKNKALVYENTRAGNCILLLPNLNPNQTHDWEIFLTRKDFMAVAKDRDKGIPNGRLWQYTHKKDGTKLASPFMSGDYGIHRANLNFVAPDQRRDGEVAYMHIKRREPQVKKSAEEAAAQDAALPF